MKTTRLTILLIILILFAVFVWPTQYRYDHGMNNIPYRTERFNGNVQVIREGTWVDRNLSVSFKCPKDENPFVRVGELMEIKHKHYPYMSQEEFDRLVELNCK